MGREKGRNCIIPGEWMAVGGRVRKNKRNGEESWIGKEDELDRRMVKEWIRECSRVNRICRRRVEVKLIKFKKKK
jgi:hypothetical protein